MLTRLTSIHLASYSTFRIMAPLEIQHNISTIFCLCISFGSIFLLCCGCFGKCFTLCWHSLCSTKVLIFLLNSVSSVDGIAKPTHSTSSFSLGQITFRGEIFLFLFKLNPAGRTFLRFIFKILSSSSIEYLIILIMGRFTVVC